ncbi:hypothetical protein AYM40_32810 [Paraburkholderia phytofirmans OLGA172]|uniref:HTH araC/xylS-type domain-containing protein n=1 Tax=Paraburkholderia phytofirmans OLGA172 TaxID=1417228 RepID=A0A160FVB5_9BURK|nr:AraC family transcriptional regulator [Paraburkholderia phytofirmans]ANB76926.1 hypothetical protein AYM40_32810 [Paraburkholderia phytofirmans OLGA172]
MSATALAPRGLFERHLLVVATQQVVAGQCKRPVVTLLLSTNGRPFRLTMPGIGSIEANVILVAPQQQRALQSEGPLLSVNVEPGHAQYNSLRSRLRGDAIVVLDPGHFLGLNELSGLFEGGSSARAAASSIDAVLKVASGPSLKSTRLDDRVADVLTYVHASLPERPPIATLAKLVGLSEDRLSHLFAETVGVPLRSYVVWLRYRLAMQQISRTERLTELANKCGFSDAAHMTRTFVEFFGFSPSLVLRSGFVQDFAPCK